MTKGDLTKELSDRQIKAIPHLVTSPTFEEGRKKAMISKNALYKWLKNPAFKDELIQQRNIVITEAMETLKANIGQAINALIELLDTEKESLKRQVANDILNHGLKVIELQEMEKRLSELERIVFA